jgi:threonine-phosphate decarboxylase
MHGGRIYEYAEKSGRSSDHVFDFSANINPMGPPTSVRTAIQDAFNGIRHYPDARHIEVIQAICSKYPIAVAQSVFCGNGASEVIDLTIRALTPRRVFLFEPAFSEYQQAAERVRAEVVHIPLFAGASFGESLTDLGELLHDIVSRCRPGDLVVINNPHNPTGLCWRREEFIRFVDKLGEREAMVLVDESFMDFRPDEPERTVMPDTEHLKNLIVVRSATKMYAIPGLRFGFGVAHADLVKKIEVNRDRWSVNHLAQAAAIAAYQDEQFVRATFSWLKREHGYVLQTWGRHEAVQIYPPSANYFLIHVREDLPVESIVARLEREGMFVRRCGNFRGLGAFDIRIAIRSHEDNERLWNAFNDALRRL